MTSSHGDPGAAFSSSTILTNQVILEESAGKNYQEIRHIVLRGKNEAIGKAVAQLSKEHYQAQPILFDSAEHKRKRQGYIQKFYPALADRCKGIAAYYGWDDNDLHDCSALWYDVLPVNCSAIFFPRNVTADGHSFQARNMDFYRADVHELMRPGDAGKGNKLFSRNFVMETYPQDGGYATLVIGTFDLLNGAYDGFNEYGLCISGLVDQNLAEKTVPLSELEAQEGLNYLQMVKAILEQCRTVDEAKQQVSGLKVYFPMDGMHFLIGDRNGDSTVLEFSELDYSPRFVDPTSPGPSIMTNHPVYKYPSIDTFPSIDTTKPYDTFYRYLRLHAYLQASVFHKYSPDDGLYAMSMVYGFVNDSSEGAAMPLPLRTVWSLVMDLDDLTMKIKFYTVDNDADQEPAFTDPYTFSLRR